MSRYGWTVGHVFCVFSPVLMSYLFFRLFSCCLCSSTSYCAVFNLPYVFQLSLFSCLFTCCMCSPACSHVECSLTCSRVVVFILLSLLSCYPCSAIPVLMLSLFCSPVIPVISVLLLSLFFCHPCFPVIPVLLLSIFSSYPCSPVILVLQLFLF